MCARDDDDTHILEYTKDSDSNEYINGNIERNIQKKNITEPCETGSIEKICKKSHVLKDLLNDGLINSEVAFAMGTAITITSLPPGLVEASNGSTTSQLNLFMYRVSANSGYSNLGYPSRNGRGQFVNNPPLALNLHYLLTAFGERELHSEILLGYGMHLLHENPVLFRSTIRTSLSSASALPFPSLIPIDSSSLS